MKARPGGDPKDSILLRDLVEKDFEASSEMNSDPLVQQFIGGMKSREESQRGFRYALRNSSKAQYPLRMIVLAEEDRAIGYCGMQPLPELGFEIYFGLDSRYWGRGFARYAVKSYLEAHARGLDRVYAMVYLENVRSCKVLEASGFRFVEERFYEPQASMHLLYCRETPKQ